MAEEIENMINSDEKARLEENKKHEKEVNHLSELNADYKNDLEKQLSAPTNAAK